MFKKKIEKWKPEIAASKHRKILKDTDFEKKCADCNGASSNLVTSVLNKKTMMLCGNYIPRASFVTGEQARICNGECPNPHAKEKHKHFLPTKAKPAA